MRFTIEAIADMKNLAEVKARTKEYELYLHSIKLKEDK